MPRFYFKPGRGKARLGALIESTEKLAVRTETDELQNFSIWLAVDQQKIRFEVAFPVIAPLSCQSMVTIVLRQRSIVG